MINRKFYFLSSRGRNIRKKHLKGRDNSCNVFYNFYNICNCNFSVSINICSKYRSVIGNFCTRNNFQSFYNIVETGVFVLKGLTFMGGLVGGALTFVTFALSTKNKTIRKCFFPVAEFGLFFPTLGKTVIPTQLIEAIFLAILFVITLFFTLKNDLKGFNLPFYCIGYAIFRFIIEFFRADPRGAFLGFLSPSQVQSILFLLIGIVLLVLRIKKPTLYEMPQEEKE